MPKLNKTGVRGLYRDVLYFDPATKLQIPAAEACRRIKGGEKIRTELGDRLTIDLRWRDPTTGERQRHAELLPANITTTAAKERAREILNAAMKGKFNPKQVAPKTLHEALDAYLVWSATNRPRSMQSRKTQIRVLKEKLGNPKLRDLSAFAIERFKRNRMAEIAEKPVKLPKEVARLVKAGKMKAPALKQPDEYTGAASVNRALASLKHMLTLAVSWGWIEADKALALRAVKLVKEPTGRVRCLTPDEETKIMAALPSHLRPIMQAANLSGMRRSEAVLLRKDAVDLASRTITLTRTKNGKIRRVPVNATLAALLETAMGSPGEYVFPNTKGKAYRVDTVSRAFCRAARKAGVANVRFHDTRHSYATRLRRKGVGIDVLQELGGWSSLAMVRRYAHVGKEELHAAVAKLDPTPVARQLPDTPEADDEKDNVIQLVGAGSP